MEALVDCPCGHDVRNHTMAGCKGLTNAPCTCTYTESHAFHAATQAVIAIGFEQQPRKSSWWQRFAGV